jgi:hypothetical protein
VSRTKCSADSSSSTDSQEATKSSMSPYACVAHGRLPITPLEPFSAHLLGNTAFYEQERYPDGLSQLPSRLALSS